MKKKGKIRGHKTIHNFAKRIEDETNDDGDDNINNNNNNNNNNNDTPQEQEILGWYPAGDSLISWGDESSSVLVGNPSIDGVSIKTQVCRHLKPNPQLLWANYV